MDSIKITTYRVHPGLQLLLANWFQFIPKLYVKSYMDGKSAKTSLHESSKTHARDGSGDWKHLLELSSESPWTWALV
jgi:hypothetical protein